MKQRSPSARRNRDAILEVLKFIFPKAPATILEIASGSGEHVVHFASAFPQHHFIATDPSMVARASVEAWVSELALSSVETRDLDVTAESWPVDRADVVLCINMIHIAPWPATEGLFRGAQRTLPLEAPLVLYGPYRVGGRHTSESNVKFESWLKAKDPRFGVRNLDDVVDVAQRNGFELEQRFTMPANNFTLLFRKLRVSA